MNHDGRVAHRTASIVPALPGFADAAFTSGWLLVVAGVAFHFPMFLAARPMGWRMAGMEGGGEMIIAMGAILLGTGLAACGLLVGGKRRVGGASADLVNVPFGRRHMLLLTVLAAALVIDTMKPATLGFVLPGMAAEYGLERSEAAWLPLIALGGTAAGSLLWGWMADRFGRRSAILLAVILFIGTSVCGAMPSLGWNLAMCFLMGLSAGGMLPIVYTLLAETMPASHRSWLIILVPALGMAGGYFAASLAASILEPLYGWRSLWLLGLRSGCLLALLGRFIPETRPATDSGDGRSSIPGKPASATISMRLGRLNLAFGAAGLSWGLVSFGLLLWLPSLLAGVGVPVGMSSPLLSRAAFIALPVIPLVALAYVRIGARRAAAGLYLLTAIGLVGVAAGVEAPAMLTSALAVTLIGLNGALAVLAPFAAELYPMAVRGRGSGWTAGATKAGGLLAQLAALTSFVPALAGLSLGLASPLVASAMLLWWATTPTRASAILPIQK